MEKTAVLGEIQRELEACGNKKMSDLISNVLERQADKNIRTLGIIGDDLVGKSTIINYLLGEEVLPTTVIPTTAEITIKHGLTERIYGRDGTVYEKDKLSQLTEELAYLTIELDNAFLKDNALKLKEFHGLLSKSKLSNMNLMSEIYKCDAIILVMTAEHLLSEPECAFIENYSKYVGESHILLVVNKLSAVGESEVIHVLDYAKNQIENKFDAVRWTVFDSTGRNEHIIDKYVTEDIKQGISSLFTISNDLDEKAINNTLLYIKEQLEKQKANLADLEGKSIEEITKKKEQNNKQKELEKAAIETSLIEFQQKRNETVEAVDQYIKERFDRILSDIVSEFSNAENKYFWYENDLEKIWRKLVISASNKVDKYTAERIGNDVNWLNDLLKTSLGIAPIKVDIADNGLSSAEKLVPYAKYKKYAPIGIGGGVVIGYCLFRIIGAAIGLGGGLLAYSYLGMKDVAQTDDMKRKLYSKIRDISSATRDASRREIEKTYSEMLVEFKKEATEIIDAKFVISDTLDDSFEEKKRTINKLITKIEEV